MPNDNPPLIFLSYNGEEDTHPWCVQRSDGCGVKILEEFDSIEDAGAYLIYETEACNGY